MCFTVPYEVIGITGNKALLEGGKTIRLGSDVKAKKGDFVQVVGNIAVSKLSRTQGQKIRRLIARLNQSYAE